jgi:peptidoglycan hydrolase-like protein with peptidoglycan-binding domain
VFPASPRLRRFPRFQTAVRNAPPMRQGESGPPVRALQQALADLGADLPGSFRNGDFDGIYGPETTRVVRQFQAKHGLAVDGVTGRQTLSALDRIFLLNDPFYKDPQIDEAETVAQMSGPPEQRPFASTSGKKA